MVCPSAVLSGKERAVEDLFRDCATRDKVICYSPFVLNDCSLLLVKI